MTLAVNFSVVDGRTLIASGHRAIPDPDDLGKAYEGALLVADAIERILIMMIPEVPATIDRAQLSLFEEPRA